MTMLASITFAACLMLLKVLKYLLQHEIQNNNLWSKSDIHLKLIGVISVDWYQFLIVHIVSTMYYFYTHGLKTIKGFRVPQEQQVISTWKLCSENAFEVRRFFLTDLATNVNAAFRNFISNKKSLHQKTCRKSVNSFTLST